MTHRTATSRTTASTASTYNTFRGPPDVVGATSATWSYEVTVPYEGEWTVQAIAVDTAGQSDLRSADRTWIVSDTAVPPTVTIAAPAVMIPPTTVPALTMSPGSPVTFSGTATDDEGLNYVDDHPAQQHDPGEPRVRRQWGIDVQAGQLPDLAGRATSAGPPTTGPTPRRSTSTPGTYSFSVQATDDLGLTTSISNQGRLTINVQVPGDAFPNGTISPTGTVNGVQVLHLDLAGTATDDIGVAARPGHGRGAGHQPLPPAQRHACPRTSHCSTRRWPTPDATSTTWTLSVEPADPGRLCGDRVRLRHVGPAGSVDLGATSRYPIYPGDLPPTVTENLLAPTDGTAFTDGKIFVSGRVEDDQQIAQAQVAIVNGLGQYMSSSGAFTSTTAS